MIVVHTLWDASTSPALHMWAESSELYNTRSGSRTTRTTRTSHTKQSASVASHPFALAHDTLLTHIGEFAGSLATRSMGQGTLTLRLPATTKRPLPSPSLLVDQVSEEQGTLRQWTVPTLTLAPGLAFDVLLALPHIPPYGIVFGDSLRYWATVANLSLELLTRQAYVSALVETGQNSTTQYTARWKASIIGIDEERVASLSRMMPPLCWSTLSSDSIQPSHLRDIVQNFLDQTIDAFIRESYAALMPTKRGKNLPLPEQWLRALTTTNTTYTTLTGSPDTLKQFSSTLRSWLDQLMTSKVETPFRTCFRLEVPEVAQTSTEDNEGANATWRLTFHLQANDDPSLLVPAEQVWNERSGTLTFLKRTFENPQERLLTDLAMAARLFPLIETSLHTARPQEIGLTTEQAYQFLRQATPLLEQSGFGVLVPPWWQKNNARLRARLQLKPKVGAVSSSSLLGLDGVVAYDWQIALGDTTLSFKEFERIVKLKMPLVQVRGQWVELQPHEIEKAIAFFKKKQHKGEMSLNEALRLGLGQNDSELGLPVEEVEAEGWIDELLHGLQEGVNIQQIEQPDSLHGTLRPYQRKGFSWLAFLKQFGLGACLADDMGLGKCCSADTLIFVNGTLRTAEALWEKHSEETMFDGEGYWTEPTAQLYINAINETTGHIEQASVQRLYRQHITERLRKVRLEDGSSVTITSLHKLLTNKGWTNELQIGDYVCLPAKLIYDGKAEDPDLIKFLAWQIAEGHESLDSGTVRITQKDAQILETLQECICRIGEKHNIVVNYPGIHTYAERPPYLTVTSIMYRRFLQSKGYQWGNLSKEKRIPDFIMQSNLDSIRIFLQNFFEAEGSVVTSMTSVEISTASSIMIQQLSCLLRRFGIWMRTSLKEKRATNGSGIFRPYYFGIIGGNALRKFCKEIGFVSSRKQGKLEKLCETVCNTNVEGIPASDIMAQIVTSTKLPIRHFGMPTVYVTGTQQFSQTSLKTVITAFDNILSGEAERAYRQKPSSKWTRQTLDAYANLDKKLLISTQLKLQHLVNQEVYYCRIKEIEDIQYDGWVYDFEVEQHHNYVANNIICHNTVQLITLLLHERVAKEVQQATTPTLLICPMSIVGNWQRELQRFAPSLSVMVHHGPDRLSGETLLDEMKRHDVVLTTYNIALRDKEDLAAMEWENVVIDEAQNIKNETAKQTQAIKQLHARYKVALTGTPVENRLSELWSIMEFLNPGYLGSGEGFRKAFAIPIERYHDKERADTLRRVIQPFVLRRQKTDKSIIQDLPEKMEMKVFCNLTREQASLYEAVVKEMMEKIQEAEGMERRGLILATLTKLKQVCNHPAQFIGDGSSLPRRSGKLIRLEEMLEEVQAEGDKALIFTQYAEMGEILRRYLQDSLGYETLFLHGGTPKKQRDAMVQRFQEDRAGTPFFILSIKAGGVGLNLTAANHVFHFDRWWNPAVENQATDRAFRIGQKRNVQVHKFICVGTLEERIDQMIEQKRELAENIVGSGENWLTEMSTSQLKELFALSRDAVGE